MKFYQEDWFIWLTLILFAPLGVILLWTQKKFKLIPRIILSVAFLIFFIGIVTGGSDIPALNDLASNMPNSSPA